MRFIQNFAIMAAQLVIVTYAADEEDDEIEVAKIVAWAITGFVVLFVLTIILTYCICSRMVVVEGRNKENKQFARS